MFQPVEVLDQGERFSSYVNGFGNDYAEAHQPCITVNLAQLSAGLDAFTHPAPSTAASHNYAPSNDSLSAYRAGLEAQSASMSSYWSTPIAKATPPAATQPAAQITTPAQSSVSLEKLGINNDSTPQNSVHTDRLNLYANALFGPAKGDSISSSTVRPGSKRPDVV